jgi:hypothetical protein
MDAFLEATAAARELTAAVKRARVFGLVLAVGVGERTVTGEESPEVRVYVAGHEEAVEDERESA